MSQQEDSRVKIVYYDVEGKLAIERVWAAQEGPYYRLKNVPFFADSLAYDDVISVEEDNGELFFDQLIEASGRSTVHLVLFDEQHGAEITRGLLALGCDWEGFSSVYFAVDVPKEVAYQAVKQYLEKAQAAGKLGYKEACLAHETL